MEKGRKNWTAPHHKVYARKKTSLAKTMAPNMTGAVDLEAEYVCVGDDQFTHDNTTSEAVLKKPVRLKEATGKDSPANNSNNLEDQVYRKIMQDISETQQGVFQEMERKRMDEVEKKNEMIQAKEDELAKMRVESLRLRDALEDKTSQIRRLLNDQGDKEEVGRATKDHDQISENSTDGSNRGSVRTGTTSGSAARDDRRMAIIGPSIDNDDVVTDLISENESLRAQVSSFQEFFTAEKKRHEDMVVRIDAERTEYRAVMEDINTKFQLLKTKQALLEKESEEITGDNNRLKIICKQQEDTLKESELNVEEHEMELKELREILDEIKSRYAKEMLQKEVFKAELKAKDDIIQRQEQQIKETEERFEMEKAELEDSAKRIRQETQRLQEKADESTSIATAERMSLEDQLTDLEKKLATKNKQIEISNEEKRNLQQQLWTTEERFNMIQMRMVSDKQLLAALMKSTEQLNDKAFSQATQITQYQKEIEKCKAELTETKENLRRAMDDAHAQKDYRIKYLERTVSDSQAVIRGLTTNLQKQKDALNNLKARLNKGDELEPHLISYLPPLGNFHGEGSYGSVYQIELNGLKCKAKRLHDIVQGQDREERVSLHDKKAAYERFRKECISWSHIQHPNIVQFLGVHYGPETDYGFELTLVMECLYMDLQDFLKEYDSISMWLKMSILLDICQGITHLHSKNIVHRNLTATNVLMTTSFQAKIADLGVSKIIDIHPLRGTEQSMIPGSLGYMPPEAVAEQPQYGYATDVFSFGVLMLYVMIQEYPDLYENPVTITALERREIQIHKRMKWINRIVSEGLISEMVCDCLHDNQMSRPSTKDIYSKLFQISQKYPKPFEDLLDLCK